MSSDVTVRIRRLPATQDRLLSYKVLLDSETVADLAERWQENRLCRMVFT
jgi:hypothetical protein